MTEANDTPRDLKLCRNEQCDRWVYIGVDYCCAPCRFSDGGKMDGGEGVPKYMIEHAEPRCSERQKEFDAITPAWMVRRYHVR